MEDVKAYGRYKTMTGVDPNSSYFMAIYPDGKLIRGNNLFKTGWDQIPNGLKELKYVLSTGHIIAIPRFKAYLPLIEVSDGLDGSRVFHSINVKCLGANEVVVYSIILRQSPDSKLKIGDVVISKEGLPKSMSKSWKFTDRGSLWL
jgi:hypothetical protein